MAANPVCSIPNCGKPHAAHGFCQSHYLRNRKYGNPLAGGTAQGEPMRYYQETVLPYDGDECLLWPYAANNGYAVFHIAGKMKQVCRVLCTDASGPPPTPEHEAAHSCGNGNKRCVTKTHLRWATPKENNADKIAHGTLRLGEMQANAKLTRDQVLRIMELRGSMFQYEIAEIFGVSQSTVQRLHAGKAWTWLNSPVHNAPETY